MRQGRSHRTALLILLRLLRRRLHPDPSWVAMMTTMSSLEASTLYYPPAIPKKGEMNSMLLAEGFLPSSLDSIPLIPRKRAHPNRVEERGASLVLLYPNCPREHWMQSMWSSLHHLRPLLVLACCHIRPMSRIG
jgi:hypothetical protein